MLVRDASYFVRGPKEGDDKMTIRPALLAPSPFSRSSGAWNAPGFLAPPAKNEGATIHRLSVPDNVPVDWPWIELGVYPP